jgi:hypothetical protein
MITSILKTGLIKTAFLLILYIVLMIQSCVAQTARDQMDAATHERVKTWDKEIGQIRSRNRPLYVGLDVSLGAPSYQITSNVDALKDLPVNFFGGMAAGVLANPVGKIKGGIGIYYSGENVPYSFDLIAANLTVNLYLLRVREVKYHTFEPYVFAGISQMRNKFYGFYLQDSSVPVNYSQSEAPYLGSVNTSHALVGTGIEYQLENNNSEFVHIYAELAYGTNVHTGSTTNVLSSTSVANSLWVTVGVSFGKTK